MSNRCYICDWSPSNEQSLFRPDYMDDKNKLFEDKAGQVICHICILKSEAMFKGKKIRDIDTTPKSR